MRTVDLTGLKFAALTVVEKLGADYSRSRMRTMYRCKCECGGYKITSGRNLRAGDIKSCGCLVGKPRSHHGPRDFRGDDMKKWGGIADATQMLHDILCASVTATEDSVMRYRVLGVLRHRMEGNGD